MKWNVVPPDNLSGSRLRWLSTNTGTRNGGSSPHQPCQFASSGNVWKPNIPAPMISAPTSSKYAAAYRSSTPVVPAPEVSWRTRSRNVRVAT
jgi:hypothetical protein